MATSGTFRIVIEPWFTLISTLVCHQGMPYCVLIPPPLPVPLPRFHTVSESLAPPAPVVVNVVAPTCVIYGLSLGKSIKLVYAAASPDALKNDCPCAAIS